MGDKSKIEWTDASWNPVSGCTKVSAGCKNCYAERWFPRVYNRPFTKIKLHPERLDQPLRWKRPRKIFVNSMSDLFHEAVPFDFVEKVYWMMDRCPQHIFQVLTKRPERMLEFFKKTRVANLPNGNAIPLANVWWGVSVENQKTADERIPLLLQTPAVVRFLSCEPLLGPIPNVYLHPDYYTGIDWVIVGGESGPLARQTDPEWVLEILEQCENANVPFFFKQWGEWLPSGQNDADGNNQYTDEKYIRIGKKKAGRSLNGLTYDGFPRGLNV